jgi:glucose-1-phosphate cytidylyltransferase
MEDTKVVILCGGKGTRLHEETETKPKPLVAVGQRPILWHIMKIYSHYGFRHFVLCLGYKGDHIKKYFLDYDLMCSDFTVTFGPGGKKIDVHEGHVDSNWSITFVDTGEEAMTGARLKRIEKYVGGKTFMVTYGDGVANVDIRRLFEFHRKHGKVGTVTGVRPSSRFGELIVKDDGVSEFSEKPQTGSGYINGGFFVFEPGIFHYVEDNDHCVFEKTPLERLAADGQLQIFRHHTFWHCMDTFRDKETLCRMWDENRADWKVWK